MADERDLPEDEAPPPRRRGLVRTIAKWVAIALAAVVLLIAGLFGFLHTESGRRFVAHQIEALEFGNGMKIGIGRLSGNLFGTLTVDRLTVSDPTGEFLAVPQARLDWRPVAYLFGHVDVRSLTAQTVTLERVPHFKPTPQTGPLLPDIDIDVGTLKVDRFVALSAVTGKRRVLTLAGTAHIADGRALANLNAETIAVEGEVPGGDRLVASLDAVPDKGLLGMNLSLDAPADGVLAAMSGIHKPVVARLAGKGDWNRWDGRFIGTLGGEQLADIAIAARNGKFRINGDTRIAQLVPGQVARLLGPVTAIDLSADFAQRRAVLDGTVTSDTLHLTTKGTVDLGQSRFDDLDVSAVLLRPAEIAKNMVGNGLRANLTFNGAFKRPTVDYDVAAAQVKINDIVLDRFAARGQVTMSDKGYMTPLHASAARITGLDSIAGGTLDNVRLDGNLAVQGSRILSDDLHLRSSRIDAKLTVIADLSKGFYAGAINGRINNYRVASVGIFNIDSKLDLKTGRSGYAIEGRVRARSTQITNESVASFLGGQIVAAANLHYGADGVVRVSQVQLESPLVHVTGGSGSYDPGGKIALNLDAQTERYGPVKLALHGTLEAPHAVIEAAHPGFGIGLADLSAEITGKNGSYALKAKGNTDYGPLVADVTLDLANAKSLKINSANLGGIDFTGAVTQTPQGPFAGELQAHGKGLGGVVRLAAAGKYQQADFNLRANDTRLDGPVGVYLGSAIIDGRAVLYDRPEIQLDAQLGNFTYGQYRFTAARAQVDYKGGTGAAKFVAEGSNAFPLRLAGNVEFKPDLWSAVLKGRIRGIDIATKGAARIVPRADGYELLPSTLTVGGGTARLAGKYGNGGTTIQSRVEGIDLSLVNSFIPALGVGGTLNGSLDFAQASPEAFPSADARIKIDGFTRTTAATVSQPVDIHFAGKLLPDGGEGSAVFRRGSTVVGRMQASLRPLGPGAGGWLERLLGAPLSGGLRYNGPADTLFSLAGQADQRVSGPVGIAADFSGRVRAPQLVGVIKANDLTYENLTYGTALTKLAVDGRFTGDRFDIASLTANAGDGTLSAKGYVSLAAESGFPMDVTIALANARLASSDNLAATASGNLHLTKNAKETPLLSGEITLPNTRYRFVREGAEKIPQLTGVHFKPRAGRAQITGNERVARAPNAFGNVRLNIKLTAPERFYVSGMGLESEWSADLTVGGTSTQPRLTGSLEVVRGTLGFAGHEFKIDQGRVDFVGDSPIDPRIAFTATEDIDATTVHINVSGRSSEPQIAFTSTPGLPQDEVVSRILFGRSAANLSSIQALQLAASLNSLRGGAGFNPLDKLRSATGLDRLRVLGADETEGRGTAIAAGKYITDNIYIEVITDARGFTATQLEISLTKALSIISQAGGSGATNFSIRYEKNY